MKEKLERIVEFTPAYDKRSDDPKKNCGIGSVTLRMVLKGEKGAVQFVLHTLWQLPHVTEEFKNKFIKNVVERIEPYDSTLDKEIKSELKLFWSPLPADLGFHSKFPMYEGQTPMGAVKYDHSKSTEEYERLRQDGILDDLTPEERLKALIPEKIETGTFDPCEYTDGGPCYYDGSTLNAEPVYKILLEEGSDGVWKYLEEYYEETFKDVEPNVAARV